jgi:hypothetical protein
MDNVFLQVITLCEPAIFRALMHAFAALRFGTSLTATSLVLSLVTIVAYRGAPTWRNRSLPRYRNRRRAHHPRSCLASASSHGARARAAGDLAHHSERGPYTGVMIVGAIATGNVRLYVEHFLRWHAPDKSAGSSSKPMKISVTKCERS